MLESKDVICIKRWRELARANRPMAYTFPAFTLSKCLK